jgi:hypothetical protein
MGKGWPGVRIGLVAIFIAAAVAEACSTSDDGSANVKRNVGELCTSDGDCTTNVCVSDGTRSVCALPDGSIDGGGTTADASSEGNGGGDASNADAADAADAADGADAAGDGGCTSAGGVTCYWKHVYHTSQVIDGGYVCTTIDQPHVDTGLTFHVYPALVGNTSDPQGGLCTDSPGLDAIHNTAACSHTAPWFVASNTTNQLYREYDTASLANPPVPDYGDVYRSGNAITFRYDAKRFAGGCGAVCGCPDDYISVTCCGSTTLP